MAKKFRKTEMYAFCLRTYCAWLTLKVCLFTISTIFFYYASSFFISISLEKIYGTITQGSFFSIKKNNPNNLLDEFFFFCSSSDFGSQRGTRPLSELGGPVLQAGFIMKGKMSVLGIETTGAISLSPKEVC